MPAQRTNKVVSLALASCLASSTGQSPAAEPASPPLDYRDRRPAIDTVDRLRILSRDKAAELERQVEAAYDTLAPSVVRLWGTAPDGRSFDEQGRPLAGALSGVVISHSGLILTCAHHGVSPESPTTVELADGKRVRGTMLGRFETAGGQPDLGLARIDEPGPWPAAVVGPSELPEPGTVCLGIGYPGSLPPGSPPQLRLGRTMPAYPEYPWLLATTTWQPGDSGGPLFDLAGRVLGVVTGGEHHAAMQYQAVAPLSKHRAALEAGEIVSTPSHPVRAARTRMAYPPAFAPAPDLEDTVQPAAMYLARLVDAGIEVALGLIVDPEGWVVTKRTLVLGRSDLLCALSFTTAHAKSIVPARVVAESVEHDLALLKFDGQLDMAALRANGYGELRWANSQPRVGKFVATLGGRHSEPLQFAAVGSTTSPESPPGTPPQIMLDTEAGPDGEPVYRDGAGRPPGMVFIHAEAEEFRRLFRDGDVITRLGGLPTPTMDEYGRAIDRLVYGVGPDGKTDYGAAAQGSIAGEPLVVAIRRDGQAIEIPIIRVSASGQSTLTLRASPLSRRRDGFPAVFAHDGRLRPEQCGGPLVDLEGRVVGLNIARADSTRTLAVPADELQKLVTQLRAQAKLTP